MDNRRAELIVVGAGPAGYVGAIRASQLGLKPVLLEGDRPGGVCLNWGCIPSKALIHQAEVFSSRGELEKMGVVCNMDGFSYRKVQAHSREVSDQVAKGVEFLLKKNGIEVIPRRGKLIGEGRVELDDGSIYQGDKILVATGSRPRELPALPFDGKRVLSSNDVLAMTELPGSMIILGGGAIGCEFAHILGSFGVKIALVEMMEHLLPGSDSEIVRVLEQNFKRRKIKVHTGTRMVSTTTSKGGVTMEIEKGDKKDSLKADAVLVVTGRVPNTEELGLEQCGIELDRGFIPVGERLETRVPGVWAAGDIVAGPMLAHLASHQAEVAVESMAGHSGATLMPNELVPGCVYTEPQIAGFGLTSEAAEAEGREVRSSTFPYKGAGKAAAIGRTEGLAKMVIDPVTEEILGAHVVGANATEVIHELLVATTAELLPEDIAHTIHAHPTLSEAVMEMAKGLSGGAIHI